MKKYIIFIALLLTCAVGAFMAVTPQTKANSGGSGNPFTGGDLCGWAWSSTIGWINFNSSVSNCPTASQQQQAPEAFNSSDKGSEFLSILVKQAHAQTGGATYKVSLDSSGNLNGYAWSSNIGWIQFGDPRMTTPSKMRPSQNTAMCSEPNHSGLES